MKVSGKESTCPSGNKRRKEKSQGREGAGVPQRSCSLARSNHRRPEIAAWLTVRRERRNEPQRA